MGSEHWKGKLEPSDTLDLPIRIVKSRSKINLNYHVWEMVLGNGTDDDASIVGMELQNATPLDACNTLIDKLLSERGLFD